MDEVESMWMEMVVLEIDLMNIWIDVYGFDICEADDIMLLAYESCKEG